MFSSCKQHTKPGLSIRVCLWFSNSIEADNYSMVITTYSGICFAFREHFNS